MIARWLVVALACAAALFVPVTAQAADPLADLPVAHEPAQRWHFTPEVAIAPAEPKLRLVEQGDK